jgi:hypothetical protein
LNRNGRSQQGTIHNDLFNNPNQNLGIDLSFCLRSCGHTTRLTPVYNARHWSQNRRLCWRPFFYGRTFLIVLALVLTAARIWAEAVGQQNTTMHLRVNQMANRKVTPATGRLPMPPVFKLKSFFFDATPRKTTIKEQAQ